MYKSFLHNGRKNSLKDIHNTIMKEKERKRNPQPLKNEGQGS